MLSDYFKCYTTPDLLAKRLKFQGALLLWESVNDSLCFKFERRGYTRDDATIQNCLKDPNKAVLLQVQNYHWVVATGKSIFGGYNISDPWTGKRTTTRDYANQITGFASFTK